MQERRRYVRLNIPLEVNYNIQGREATRWKAITKNISAGGARFTINEELPKDSVLNLDIKIPIRPRPIPVKAKVVWSKKEIAQGKNAYDVGFEFVQISEESKNVFFQYLCDLMSKQLKEFK